MIITLYDNALQSSSSGRITGTWEDIAAFLGPHSFLPVDTDKRRLPAFLPGELTSLTAPRAVASVSALHLLAVDLDDITLEELSTVQSTVAGLAHVIYTTWSHSRAAAKGLLRMRLVLPLSTPVPRASWSGVWDRAMAWLGVRVDRHCRDASRIYFRAIAPEGTHPHFISSPGRALDPDDLPVLPARPKAAPSQPVRLSREMLERAASRWRKKDDDGSGDALRAVIRGEPFAEPGDRETAVWRIAMRLAVEFPGLDPVQASALFAPSLQVMQSDWIAEVEVADRLRRAQQYLAEAEAPEAPEDLLTAAHGRATPYSYGEVAGVAPREWILQHASQWYFRVGTGYRGPYTKESALTAALRDLAPATTAGVVLTAGRVRKPLQQITDEYGTVVDRIQVDLTAREATYDAATRTLTEAPCPLRDLVPTYDPEVARWLELLTHEHYPEICQWLAALPDLRRTLAAVVLTGPPGTGKSLFAAGCAQLWRDHSGPTTLTQAISSYNAALAACPLAHADEQLPKDFNGFGRTSEIREFISSLARPYTRKYLSDSVMLGAVRLVVTANNTDILAINEQLSPDDIEAISERFYLVRVDAAAAAYLRTVDAESFVTENRLARHALWLQRHMSFTRHGRFQLENNRGFARLLTVRSGIRSACCQWLLGYLRNPLPVEARKKWGAAVVGGELFITTECVVTYWDQYVTNEQCPKSWIAARALTALAQVRRYFTAPDGAEMAYRSVDIKALNMWALESGWCSEEDISHWLSRETPGFRPGIS